MSFKRGDIWWAELPDETGSCVQQGIRPVLIVSNQAANTHSPIVTVVPLTSRCWKKKNLPTHVKLSLPCLQNDSLALCEQILSIDKERMKKWVGYAPSKVMTAVERAMRIQLSI